MNKNILLLFLLLLSSCVAAGGNYGVISPAPMSLANLAADNEIVAEQVSENMTQHKILFIPLSSNPKIDDAAFRLIKKHQGDYLGNVSIEYRTISLLPFYQKTEWSITGDVMRVAK